MKLINLCDEDSCNCLSLNVFSQYKNDILAQSVHHYHDIDTTL